MKKLLIIATVVATFSSCIGPKKYGSFVNRYYKDTNTFVRNNSQIEILYPHSAGFTSTVKIAKGKNYCIPAILYWAINESYKCELNPGIPARIFSNAVYADSSELLTNLKGCKLEITIDSLPHRFTYHSRTDASIFIVAYVIIAKQFITSDDYNVSISYKVTRHGELIKQGNIMGVSPSKSFVNNRSTRKRITWNYLDYFDHHTKLAAKNSLHALNETLMKIPANSQLSE
ncbi:MAG: hypothetical protein ACTHJ0_02120 [Flavipsychrobacter sp.]